MFKALFLCASICAGFVASANAETFEVKMLNKGEAGKMVFEPATLKIASGDTVKFLAADKGHNAESGKGLLPEDAEAFRGKINEEIEVTFDIDGLYGVICKPHYAMGMVMTILVGETPANQDDFLKGRIPKRAKQRFKDQLAELNK